MKTLIGGLSLCIGSFILGGTIAFHITKPARMVALLQQAQNEKAQYQQEARDQGWHAKVLEHRLQITETYLGRCIAGQK